MAYRCALLPCGVFDIPGRSPTASYLPRLTVQNQHPHVSRTDTAGLPSTYGWPDARQVTLVELVQPRREISHAHASAGPPHGGR